MKNIGKKIALFFIILAIVVAILVSIVLYQFIVNYGNSEKATWDEVSKAEKTTIKGNEILYQNAWGKDIVADIKSDVPIPVGFICIEGTPEDGLIIKKEEADDKLLWIPLDKKVNLNVSDKYFQNIESSEIDSDTYESIIKYGGFYVSIGKGNEYSTLKNISQEEYDAIREESKNKYENISNMNSHLLSKEELAQIISYTEKNELSTLKKFLQDGDVIENTSVTLSQWTSIDRLIEDDDAKTYYEYETKNGKIVYIPKGFKYSEDESGYVRIVDKYNENLIYVWIPVEYEIDKVKDQIISKFNSLNINKDDIDMSFIYSMIEEEMSPQAKASIETYGGFYMAEAELSYTNEEKDAYSTKARNMNKELSSARKDDNKNVISDYFRKSDLVENGEETNVFIERANDLANNVQTQDSVTSHLTYGIEYDLAILWLIDTNAATVDQIMRDSTEIGKYKGTYSQEEENTWSARKYPYLNGLWGLGGNLAELSQETWKFEKDGEKVEGVVLRGGSYATIGNILQNGYPVHGINTIQNGILESTDSTSNYYDPDSIGIRNSLYINSTRVNNTESIDIDEENTTTTEEQLEALEKLEYQSIEEEKAKSGVKKHYGESGIIKEVKYYDTVYTWYAQNAGNWMEDPYWDNEIWDNGCGPTSVATIASGMGYNWNPGIVVDEMQYKGWNYTNKNTLQYIMHYMNINTWYIESPNRKDILSHIKKGNEHPVIICVGNYPNNYFTGGGHIMPLLGVDANGRDVVVANPNVDSPSGKIDIDFVMKYVNYAIQCW